MARIQLTVGKRAKRMPDTTVETTRTAIQLTKVNGTIFTFFGAVKMLKLLIITFKHFEFIVKVTLIEEFCFECILCKFSCQKSYLISKFVVCLSTVGFKGCFITSRSLQKVVQSI